MQAILAETVSSFYNTRYKMAGHWFDLTEVLNQVRYLHIWLGVDSNADMLPMNNNSKLFKKNLHEKIIAISKLLLSLLIIATVIFHLLVKHCFTSFIALVPIEEWYSLMTTLRRSITIYCENRILINAKKLETL